MAQPLVPPRSPKAGAAAAASPSSGAGHQQSVLDRRRAFEEDKNLLLDTDDDADKVPTSESSRLYGMMEDESQPLLYAVQFDYKLFWTALLRRHPPDATTDRWEQIASSYDQEVQSAHAMATKNFTESLGRINDEPRVQPLLMPMSKDKALERVRALHEELRESVLADRHKARSTQWKLAFLHLLLQGSSCQDALEASVRHRLEAKLSGCGSDLCYGELDPFYFYRLLKRLRLVQGHLLWPHELVFYDLGCGRGTLLFAAALAFNFHKVIGLEAAATLKELFERLKQRWDQAVVPRLGQPKLVEKKRAVSIRFRLADVLEDGQWANTGGVFLLHASGLGPETQRAIEVKMARLPRGCLVITVGRPLSSNGWALIGVDRGVTTSYGPATVYCYEKDRAPSQKSSTKSPPHSPAAEQPPPTA